VAAAEGVAPPPRHRGAAPAVRAAPGAPGHLLPTPRLGARPPDGAGSPPRDRGETGPQTRPVRARLRDPLRGAETVGRAGTGTSLTGFHAVDMPNPTPRPDRTRQGELPFTGPATFFKAPYLPLDESWEADVGILGIPYDFGVGFRPGARFAPNAVREASGRYPIGPEGYFDPTTEDFRLVGVRVVDAGDVDPRAAGVRGELPSHHRSRQDPAAQGPPPRVRGRGPLRHLPAAESLRRRGRAARAPARRTPGLLRPPQQHPLLQLQPLPGGRRKTCPTLPT
jgi:hypothetical protein